MLFSKLSYILVKKINTRCSVICLFLFINTICIVLNDESKTEIKKKTTTTLNRVNRWCCCCTTAQLMFHHNKNYTLNRYNSHAWIELEKKNKTVKKRVVKWTSSSIHLFYKQFSTNCDFLSFTYTYICSILFLYWFQFDFVFFFLCPHVFGFVFFKICWNIQACRQKPTTTTTNNSNTEQKKNLEQIEYLMSQMFKSHICVCVDHISGPIMQIEYETIKNDKLYNMHGIMCAIEHIRLKIRKHIQLESHFRIRFEWHCQSKWVDRSMMNP